MSIIVSLKLMWNYITFINSNICILKKGAFMELSQEEWDILKIYITSDKETTVHNLYAAIKCFNTLSKDGIYMKLLYKIKNMDLQEFSICCDILKMTST